MQERIHGVIPQPIAQSEQCVHACVCACSVCVRAMCVCMHGVCLCVLTMFIKPFNFLGYSTLHSVWIMMLMVIGNYKELYNV